MKNCTLNKGVLSNTAQDEVRANIKVLKSIGKYHPLYRLQLPHANRQPAGRSQRERIRGRRAIEART